MEKSEELKQERERNPYYMKGKFKLYCCVEKINFGDVEGNLNLIADFIKTKYFELKEVNLEKITNLHFSLTKNYTMSHKQISPFVDEMKAIIEDNFAPFTLLLDQETLDFFKSDSDIRYIAFKFFEGNKGYKTLKKLREILKEIIVKKFDFEPLDMKFDKLFLKPHISCYAQKEREKIEEKMKEREENFKFHISVLCTKMKINRKIIKKILEQLPIEKYLSLTVSDFTIKIGDKNYLIKLKLSK